MLIKAGADVNLAETNLGMTPLFMALEDKNGDEIVALLRAAGAEEPAPREEVEEEVEEEREEVEEPDVKPLRRDSLTSSSKEPEACCIIS